jgi:hypothetical protein
VTPLRQSSFAGSPPQQIGILVRNLHASVQAYRDVMGLDSWVGYTYTPDNLSEQRYRRQVGRFSMMFALSAGNPQVELIQPLSGPSIYHDWMKEHGEGLHHVAYVVESIDDGIDEMRCLGYPVIQYGAGYGLDGDGAFAYFDTTRDLGAILELRMLPTQRREPEWRVGR